MRCVKRLSGTGEAPQRLFLKKDLPIALGRQDAGMLELPKDPASKKPRNGVPIIGTHGKTQKIPLGFGILRAQKVGQELVKARIFF